MTLEDAVSEPARLRNMRAALRFDSGRQVRNLPGFSALTSTDAQISEGSTYPLLMRELGPPDSLITAEL